MRPEFFPIKGDKVRQAPNSMNGEKFNGKEVESMGGTREKSLWEHMTNSLTHVPVSLFRMLAGKVNTLLYETKLAPNEQSISVSPAAVKRIKLALTEQLKPEPASAFPANKPLSAADRQIVERIRRQTSGQNRDNVTRTKAYWTMYRSHPELHWALLAHMVSRNGGWSMTDLKGELLPRLLADSQINSLFAFLERANGLIFHDAYPQLLLYAESKRVGQNLLYLLPHLQISSFMQPVWEEFWQHRESTVLTIALIVNEQNYIEKRIVQDKYYQQTVLETVTFLLQSLMQLNQVMFPYRADAAREPRLAGLILEDFSDLNERIEFGKKLYAILFALPAVNLGVISFAESTPHTGSRSDYWRQLFTPIRKAPPELAFKERLTGCQLIKGADPLYSPALSDAWPDRSLGPVEPGDWYLGVNHAEPLRHFQPIQVPFHFDMTSEACLGLHKMELAVLTDQTFSF